MIEDHTKINPLDVDWFNTIENGKCASCTFEFSQVHELLTHLTQNDQCYEIHCKKHNVKQTPSLSKLHRLEVWFCGQPASFSSNIVSMANGVLFEYWESRGGWKASLKRSLKELSEK